MNELLSKLSSYNLFNYLVPGVLFAIISTEITPYHFLQKEIVLGLFLYYFLGIVVSRFGSLVIGPVLKRLRFVKFAEYRAFVLASKKDPQIEILSEVNNTYRTLSSMCCLLLFLKIYARFEMEFPLVKAWSGTALILILLLMFAFAYRKQTQFIVKRIKANE